MRLTNQTMMMSSLRKRKLKEREMRINESYNERINMNSFKRPISITVMESFLSQINNVIDINHYGTKIFEIYKEFAEDNEDNPHYVEKIKNNIVQSIIPSYQNLSELGLYIYSDDKLSCFKEAVNEYKDCDRVIHNDEKLNSRFNFDRFVSNHINDPVYETVNSLCEFIDTYNISDEGKFNIALENIPYSLYKNGVHEEENLVAEYVTNYFLTRDSIMTDTYIRKMKNVLERNHIDGELINPYVMKTNGEFAHKIHEVYGIDIDGLNSEKKISNFIMKTLDESSTKDVEGIKNSISSILSLPLAINVSKSFIESCLLNYSSLCDSPISDWIQVELESQYHSNDGFANLSILSEETEEQEVSYRYIMESDPLENDDIRNLLKKFRAEQNKDISGFRKIMNKIYAKKPEEIIDEVPHILGLVRAVFIFAPIGVPVIGPVLSLVTACVDKLINIHIDSKQTVALLKYLKDEKKKVEDKIDDLDGDKKKKADEYLKSLEKSISKVESYKYSFGDAIDYDSDSDDDLDGFDFDLESCVNSNGTSIISLNESNSYKDRELTTIAEMTYYTESLLNVLEKKDILNKIARNMDSLHESIGIIANLVVNCPITIDYNEFCEMVQDFHFDPLDINTINISHVLENAKEEKIEAGTMRNVIIESNCINQIETIINEGFKLSDLKLSWKALKSKIKDLSAKEKSMCQTLNAHASTFMNAMEKAIRSDRREAIIKGSIIPSFSRCIKLAITFGTATIINPVLGLISALGYFACSSMLNRREKQLIYDEIETELQVVEKQIQMAENDGDMNQYRFLLNYQKKLIREKQRIKYNLKVSGRPIPSAVRGKDD